MEDGILVSDLREFQSGLVIVLYWVRPKGV